jgi:hypothetical protein
MRKKERREEEGGSGDKNEGKLDLSFRMPVQILVAYSDIVQSESPVDTQTHAHARAKIIVSSFTVRACRERGKEASKGKEGT